MMMCRIVEVKRFTSFTAYICLNVLNNTYKICCEIVKLMRYTDTYYSRMQKNEQLLYEEATHNNIVFESC